MCVNGFTYVDQIDDYYQESFMSVIFKNFSFKMGYTALSTLLRELGKKATESKHSNSLSLMNHPKVLPLTVM